MADNDVHNDGLPQKRSLNVLLVEDNPDDAALSLRVLKKAQMDVHCDVVKTRQDFTNCLRAGNYDVVLSDYNLGDWTAAEGLALLRGEHGDTPFILVTGSLGDEKAVECIKNGMADCILKDRLERLPVAISRALEEKAARDEKLRAERAVRQSETQFRTLVETIPSSTFIEQGDRCCYVNRAAQDITGYSREELLAMNFSQLVHPDSREALAEQTAKRSKGDQSASRYEIMIMTKQNEMRWLDVTVGTFQLDGLPAVLTTALDITERRRADESRNLLDPLTGLANYQCMVEVFAKEADRTERTERTFALLLIVLEGVKQINDKYGHLVSSRALCRLARIMRLYCRSLDTPVRIGGDEFGFILPETEPSGALTLGGRIADRLADDTEEPVLSCSFSVVAYRLDGKTIDTVLKVAHGRLRTKKAGDGASVRVKS